MESNSDFWFDVKSAVKAVRESTSPKMSTGRRPRDVFEGDAIR